jgi:hypothetical protein
MPGGLGSLTLVFFWYGVVGVALLFPLGRPPRIRTS